MQGRVFCPLEWTNLPEPSWAKQQHRDENTGERQRQGKLLEAFWDLVMCLAHKSLCPEVYCKIRNILPNLRASSELISLRIQLKQSLSSSTSPLPKWSSMLLPTPWMLLQLFMSSIHHPCAFPRTIMEFVTPVFKSSFSSFRTIANLLNNTWSIFQLQTSYTSIKPFLLFHARSVELFDCANPVTVAQVCPSTENTGIILWDITFLTILSQSSPVHHIHAWACYSSENSFYQNIQFSEVRFTCSSSDLPGNWFMDLQMSVLSYMRVLSAKIQLFQHYRKGIAILQSISKIHSKSWMKMLLPHS